ncbi:MAG: trypsin-like serine protease [Gemmatimonadota bacterium]|nr:trypsin-like serine protease [Gemmatimonadota bacterium]
MNRAILLGVALVATAPPIILRHDADAEASKRLATGFRTLVHLNLPDGEGVLIRPDWVLTAAHVAVEVRPGHALTVGGRAAEVAEVRLHPAWDDGPHDIALLRLVSPVEHVRPVPVYRERDETGALVHIVGRGDGGTGLSGPDGEPGVLRAATNRIDFVTDAWIAFRFDDPREEGSAATALEGVSGPGDSGGPAYIERDGVRYVAGVSSAQSTRETGGREGVYGVTEFYARVSSYIAWIEEVAGG